MELASFQSHYYQMENRFVQNSNFVILKQMGWNFMDRRIEACIVAVIANLASNLDVKHLVRF